jgi:ABC-type transport system involved in multi-copper enzyme maturation permease subunit
VKVLATIAVLLLSLVGYSLGNVLRFGRKPVRRPVTGDILFVILMWAALIFAGSRLAMGKGLWIGIGIAAGLILGFLISLILGYSRSEIQAAAHAHPAAPTEPRKRFRAWRELSSKLGTFQSQILLGLLFLIVFAPVALGVKLFSDPLHIKKSGTDSHWLPKAPVASDIELFKRQS